MVFGAGGQDGRHLIEVATAAGRDMVGLSHSEADICDVDAVAAVIAKHVPSLRSCECRGCFLGSRYQLPSQGDSPSFAPALTARAGSIQRTTMRLSAFSAMSTAPP